MNDPDFRYGKNDKCYKDEKEDKYDNYDKHDKKGSKVAIACGQVCNDSLDVLDCNSKCQVASLEIDLKDFKNPLVRV